MLFGVPEIDEQSTHEFFDQISEVIGSSELVQHDVSVAHRIPSRPGKTRPIVIRFTKSRSRDEWLQLFRNEAKNDGSGPGIATKKVNRDLPAGRITAGDQLTAVTRDLLNKTRVARKDEASPTTATMTTLSIPNDWLASNYTRTHRHTASQSSQWTGQKRGGGSEDVPRVRTSSHLPVGPWIHPPIVRPKIAVLKHQGEVVPLSHCSVGRMSAHCLADTALVMGRNFRVGWGRDSTLLTLNTQKAAAVVPLRAELTDLNVFTSGRTQGDCSQCIVQRLQIFGGGKDLLPTFTETVEGHLRIQLQHCEVRSGDSCPLLVPQTGVDALHAHCALAEQLNNLEQTDLLFAYSSHVWNLCVALWGSLPDLDADSSSHLTIMLRRKAVSEWLEDVVQMKVRQETASILDDPSKIHDKEDHIPAVLSLLSGRKILDACQRTQDSGDHYTSLMLAQLCGGPATKQLVQRQLANWQDVQADKYINRDRIKLLMLTAGIPLLSGTEGTINVCEGFDWKRAFALHLWGTDCNSDHYLVIGELSVAKRVEQQVNIRRFNIPKLKDKETKQHYQVDISNRFAVLASSDEVEEELDVNSVWENIRDNIKIAAEQSIGYYEIKKKKPWFDEDCCMVVERRKEATLKFLQDPVEANRDNYFNKR
ncbi:hypothetical protein ANN_03252 [Periplaneta americana]|uniref:Nuclear pore complex protein NUP96 C-terminal domain-containing protein n=1 Tax=Periplaneta americana TaxID=6978 RepID=A0ABQ8TYM0_PERAM|nr:hypothetical protein ANN_03252 [Periplaneta americana]